MARYLHISDLHFWNIVCNPLRLINKRILGNLNLILRRRRYVRTERADSFIGLLEKVRPDALLVGGDLTTTATEEEYRQAAHFLSDIAGRQISVFLIPGNHDVYTFESCRKGRFGKYCGAFWPEPDEPDAVVLPGGVPLLRVPTVRANLISSRGYISPRQVEKTGRLLEESPPGPVIVLAHYPVLHQTPAYRSTLTRRLGNADALRRVLGASGREILYLAGHVHAFSHTRDAQFENVTYVTTRALFYQKKHHSGGFVELEEEDGKITIFPWVYRTGWQREAMSLPEMHRNV